MKAVVLKNKSFGTGGIAELCNKYADGALAVGGITLDVSVGGFNPAAVEVEAALGSKVVWMPTYSALNDPTHKKTEKDAKRNVVSPVNENGEVLEAVKEILTLIKEHGMILATGHISKQETFILVKTAVEMGLKKIVITHPLTISVGTRLSIQEQVELSEMGAYMDHCWVACFPQHSNVPLSDYSGAIRAVGVDKCILSTDLGQLHNPRPAEGFSQMLEGYLSQGFTEDEIERMIKFNPSALLDLT
jgi:hypothetical protein